jgi:hypothetical protein
MIIGPSDSHAQCSGLRTGVSGRERAERLRQHAVALCLVGEAIDPSLPYAIERRLFDLGHLPHVIDATDVAGLAGCLAAGLLTVSVATEPTALAARAALGADAVLVVRVGREAGEGDAFSVSGTVDEQVAAVIAALRGRSVLESPPRAS